MYGLEHWPAGPPSTEHRSTAPASTVKARRAVVSLVLAAGVAVKEAGAGAVRSTVQDHDTGALALDAASTLSTWRTCGPSARPGLAGNGTVSMSHAT